MTESDHYEIAKEIAEVPGVDAVRVSPYRMKVSHAPEGEYVEQIPIEMYDGIHDAIEGTLWQTDYSDPGRHAERHSWSGGVHADPILPPREQPQGYELQYLLVK